MKTKTIISTAILAAALSAGASAAQPPAAKKDQKLDKKAEQMQSDIFADLKERLKHRFAPVVKKVTAGPAKAGQPISITVSAAYDDKRAIDKVSEVRVYFSADGGSKWERPVKLSKSGADWKGSIPAQQKGTLTYYIWVKDSRGNVTTDIPCKVSSWPPANDSCMVHGAVDLEPVDDKTTDIENDIDVWDFRVGMDDSYIYLQQSVQGTIRKGTLSPTHINVYGSFVLDLWAVKQADDVMGLLTGGSGGGGDDAKKKEAAKKLEAKYKGKENTLWFTIYSPLLKSVWPGAKDCFAPRKPKEGAKDKNGQAQMMPEMDTKNVSCSAKGPDLFVRLNKSALSPAMKKEFAAIGALNMPVTEQSMVGFLSGFKKSDMLNVTRAVYNPRTLKVN